MVIGGGSGIGKAIAEALADVGAEVAIAGRQEDDLKQAVEDIKESTGKTIRYFLVDASEESSVIQLVGNVRAEIGDVDILVNSIGYDRPYRSVDDETILWDDTYQVNVRSIMLFCREFGRAMVERKCGRIINIGSARAFKPQDSGMNSAISSSEGAVDGWTKSLARDWAKYNVTVNEVTPIQTEGCVGPVLFFASDAAASVTGQHIAPY